MADQTDQKALDLVWVKSTLPTAKDGGDKVVLAENDTRHPNGEWAYIAGPTPVQVARTPDVERVLREGTAALTDAPTKSTPKSTPNTATGGTPPPSA